MKHHSCAFLILCLAAGIPGSGVAEEAAKLEERVAKIVRQLDDEDFGARTQSSKDLIALGKEALPHLNQKPPDSLEAQARVDEAVHAIVRTELLKIPGKEKIPLTLKPILCRKELEHYLPKYRFFLEARAPEQPPHSGVLVAPSGEIKEYALKEDHKTNLETALAKEIEKAGVTVKSREQAQEFGLLWLMLAYGCEEFKVENTDHQNETRYWVYGRPPAQVGAGQLARIELFVNSEKEGKVQKIHLEGNLETQKGITHFECMRAAP